jgi:hypothetical protein
VTGFVLAIAVTTWTLVTPRPSGAQDVGVGGRSLKLTVSSSGRQTLKSLQRDDGLHFGPASAASDLSGSLELWYGDTP